MTEQRRPSGVATPALVTHVRFIATVRLDVYPQQVRSEERLAADGTRVLALALHAAAAAAIVLPEMTLQRVLPEELVAADAALIAKFFGMDPHVDA